MSGNSAANFSRESPQSSWNEYRNRNGDTQCACVENNESAFAQQDPHQSRKQYLRQHPHRDYREYTDESPTDEDSEEETEGELLEAEPEPPKVIRVGEDFQAEIPPLLSKEERKQKIKNPDPENDLLFWSPPSASALTDEMLKDYLETAVTEHHYSHDQALGLLHWHKYNVKRALKDLPQFTQPFAEWTSGDKELFDQTFKYYGKAFHKMQSVFPDKSMAQIINYYYDWKKSPLHRKPISGLTGTADRPVPLNPLSQSHKSNANYGNEKNSNQMHEKFRNLSVTKANANLVPLLHPHEQLIQRHPQLLLQPRQQKFQSNSSHYNNPFQPSTSSSSGSGATLTSSHGHLVNGSANAISSRDEDDSSAGEIVID